MDARLKAALLVSLMAVGGCAVVPRTGSLCTAGPIILNKEDKLTRSTLESVVVINESGEKICGWKPPSPK